MRRLSTLLLFLNLSYAHAQEAAISIPPTEEKNCNCSVLERDRRQEPVKLARHKWQNLLRDNPKVTSGFEKKLLENFFWKCGNYACSDFEFYNIALYAAHRWSLSTDSVVFTRDQQHYVAKRINFYGSTTLDYALGTAWVIVNEAGVAVGFYDYYNFNKMPLLGKGRRSLMAEASTRFIRFFKKQTRDFILYYGIVPESIAREVYSAHDDYANLKPTRPL